MILSKATEKTIKGLDNETKNRQNILIETSRQQTDKDIAITVGN